MRGTAVAAALVALAVAAPVAGAEPSQSQEFFREKLLEDGRTSREVKDLLEPGGGGFVDRRITFEDLTGDDKADAVVRVQSGGAAGIVAVYVFSTAGAEELRAVFRSQSLQRASTRVRNGRVSYRYARFAPGDELCCPTRIDESRLRWRPRQERFVVVKRVQVGPEPEPATAKR
jgi:hypothetical protein